MGAEIKYISKIEIKGLWGKFDLEWDLQPDVNVLSGINGSGKSTILNCVSKLLTNFSELNLNKNPLIDEIGEHINFCKIIFDDGDNAQFEFINKQNSSKSEIEKKLTNYNKYAFLGENYNVNIFENKELSNKNNLFQIDTITTFDTVLKSAEAINKISDDDAKTELDWEIYHLQKRYLKYKLSTAQKTIEAINKGISNGKLLEIQANQDRFSDIIDTLFEETHKKLNRKEDEISFLLGEEKISVYQLSSGEKQLLVILLTVLVQDNKNAILFMDEPELSLHFDWQKKLIEYIRELNPNVQIILATHSPAIIMNGWMDKVSDVSDLIKPV